MVTLNHPAQGNTNWFSMVDGNWSTLEGSVGPRTLLAFAATNNSTIGSLRCWGQPDSAMAASGTVLAEINMTNSGTLRNLFARLSSAVPTGSSITLTVRINGTATNITLTINANGLSGNDTTHSATVSAGDLVEVHLDSASATGIEIIASLELAPS
jgi:hypothetical protein